jgi:hypothetical protein
MNATMERPQFSPEGMTPPDDFLRMGGAALEAQIDLASVEPFGVDMMVTNPATPVNSPNMGKPTDTATSWQGVGDSNNDD